MGIQNDALRRYALGAGVACALLTGGSAAGLEPSGAPGFALAMPGETRCGGFCLEVAFGGGPEAARSSSPGRRVGQERLAEALDAGDAGDHFVQVAFTSFYQNALRARVDTGSYEVDVIASLVLTNREAGRTVGDTDLIFWLFSIGNYGDLQPATQMATRAGLLWPTTDLTTDDQLTQFGTFGIRQFFFAERLEVGVGKLFPGMLFLNSPYAANNSETFMSKIISGDQVAGWFESIGLGLTTMYEWDRWFATAAITDAQAEKEFDFGSLAEGRFAWMLEGGFRERRANGLTSISALVYRVAELKERNAESGFAVAFTHETGPEGLAYFGRYSARSGGEGLSDDARAGELPLVHGGFAGVAWNAAFGNPSHQIALAAMYGRPNDYQRSLGFDDTYGLEAYWRVRLGETVQLSPDFQFMRNREGRLETVLGLRLKIGWDFQATPSPGNQHAFGWDALGSRLPR